MTQLHKRFTDDQVRVLFRGYCQGLLGRAEIQEMLDVGKTHFFALLKEYRQAPGPSLCSGEALDHGRGLSCPHLVG